MREACGYRGVYEVCTLSDDVILLLCLKGGGISKERRQ